MRSLTNEGKVAVFKALLVSKIIDLVLEINIQIKIIKEVDRYKNILFSGVKILK